MLCWTLAPAPDHNPRFAGLNVWANVTFLRSTLLPLTG